MPGKVGSKPNVGQPVRHRVKPTHDWIEVPNVRFEGGPALPRGKWHRLTRRWWKVISAMPLCALWDEDDWGYALETAIVAEVFYRGAITAAAELRLRGRVMGITWDARRDLRIRYVEPVNASDGEVVDLEAFRESIRG